MNRMRYWLAGGWLVALILAAILIPALARAAPPGQDDDVQTQAEAFMGEGLSLYEAGEYHAALEKCQAALQIYQQLGDRKTEGVVFGIIGLIYEKLNQSEEALQQYQKALAIHRELGDRELEQGALDHIGKAYDNLSQYRQALAYYEKALTLRRELGDRKQEAASLDQLGATCKHLGQYQEAMRYYQEALAIKRELGDRAGEAYTLSLTGSVHYELGQYPEALTYYEQALAINRELGDQAGEAANLSNTGLAYRSLWQHQEAMRYYQEALTIKRELGDRAGEADTLSQIGAACVHLGRYQEALKFYQEALVIRRELGDRRAEGTTLNNIGQVYWALGQYSEAWQRHQDALAILRESGYRAEEGDVLNSMGVIYWSQAQYQQALTYFEQALAIQRQVGNRLGEATTLNNMGNVQDTLGRPGEALAYYQEVLLIYREIGERTGEAIALMNIGIAHNHLAQRQEALRYYQQSLALSREIGDRRDEGNALSNIGLVYEILGQYQEALNYQQESLVIARELGDRVGEGNTLAKLGTIYVELGQHQEALRPFEDALAISREVGDRHLEAIIQDLQGKLHAKLGDKEEALAHYLESLALYEEMRSEIGVEELKTTYAETYKGVYERAMALLMELGRSEEAFHVGERARARTLLDQLGNLRLDPRQSDDPALIEEEETLRLELEALERSLAEEWAQPQGQRSDETIQNLSTQLEEKHAEYAKLLEILKLNNPEYASLVAVNPLTLAEVQKLLGGATLVEYFVTEDQTFVFVIDENDFQAQTLEVTREDLRRALTAFHDFASLEGTPGEMAWLYTTLFAPVRPYTKSGALIIAAHGPLHYLPFQALHDGQRYLVQDYAISYTPSASVLPFALEKRKGTAPDGSALVLGNPDVPGVPPLAYAEGEAQAVANLYETTAHSQGQATESLLRGQAGAAGLIHLACHGQYNPEAPLFSRLLLVGDARHDGFLNVHEIYNLELPQADLVTLSACQTNVGRVSQGDEVIGLNRALIYAGSPTILASLWSVDDAATGELMLSFYKHLKEGRSKAEALQAAQVEMLSQKAYAHPYYWAAFVLTGDPGEFTGELITNAATPVAAATEAVTQEPAPETPRRKLCAGVTLPIGLVVLAGLHRRGSSQARSSG